MEDQDWFFVGKLQWLITDTTISTGVCCHFHSKVCQWDYLAREAEIQAMKSTTKEMFF